MYKKKDMYTVSTHMHCAPLLKDQVETVRIDYTAESEFTGRKREYQDSVYYECIFGHVGKDCGVPRMAYRLANPGGFASA